MARTQTMVQLTDDLVASLDGEASRRGVSRSALIRVAVEALLAESRASAVTAAIVEGYRRVPPVVPDAWGSLDAAAEVAAGELAHRLDGEERAAGLSPW